MPRKKKKEETLVHLDLETMSKPVRHKKETVSEDVVLPQTLGAVLQQARQQKKLRLSHISKKLCIKEIYLEALENGHYYAFPGRVYGIGFLRSYATFLGLDANDLVDRFYQETSDMHAEPMDMPRAENTNALPPVKCVIKMLLVLLAFLILWWLISVFKTPPETIPTLPEKVETTIQEMSPATTSAITSPLDTDILTTPEVVSQPIEQPKDIRPPVSYGLKTPARVSFVATNKVWIEVRDTDADRVLLSKVLYSGDRYNPAVDAEGLVLKTANAGALTVYVDGNEIGPVGRNGVIKSGISMKAEDFLKDE